MALRRPLVLTHAHMIAMLADAGFYAQCPHFLWLQESARVAYEKHTQEECCNGTKHMQHIIEAFFRNLRDLHELDPEILQPVRVYLETRKKRSIGRIAVHYRNTAKQVVQFTF